MLSKSFFYVIILLTISLSFTASVPKNDRADNPDPDVQRQLESFRVADGFEVTLFAAEPLVVKPIQMNWDEKGRLWVVSSTAYPHVKTGELANDKIFVLEDTDGDGKADKSTIFAEGLITPTGILPGDGGVYVANSTEILHFADTDGDGKADKKRRILAGFGNADTHHLIHTFRWGPDGMLYFSQSVYIYSHVETPFGTKHLNGGGVWQLNPKTLELNVFAKGLINPWGHQFNRWGQSFLTDGAGYQGINYAFNGATFVTAPGAERILRGLNPGQPKFSGLEVLSGRHVPESWAGSLITNDFRANRIIRFTLAEQGSGYASTQADDVLWTNHVAFRPVDVNQGPDGAIYVADWYNPIIQHGEVDFHDPRRDQEHGRIWRIVAKNRPLVKKPALCGATIAELLESLKQPEDWTRVQARQLLKNRTVAEVIPALQNWVQTLDKNQPDYELQLLEALWVHQSLNVVNESLLTSLLQAKSPPCRAAALRTLYAWADKLPNTPALLDKAVRDPHPQVRLEAVISLRKLRTAESTRAALSVLAQPMDEFLDFALWQTVRELEPMWQNRLKTEPDFFGDAKKTVYALKSVSNPESVGPLSRLYQTGQVPAAYEPDVLGAIAKYGKTGELNGLLDKAVEGRNKPGNSVAAQLAALETAARDRNAKPDKALNRIAEFIGGTDEATTISALQLIGYWKLENLSQSLIDVARNGNTARRKAALGSLVILNKANAEPILTNLATGKNPVELKVLATAQLASMNPVEASRLGIALMNLAPEGMDVSPLFQAFLANKQTTEALAKGLTAKKIPVRLAKEGRKRVQQLPPTRLAETEIKRLVSALEASGGTLEPERMPQALTAVEVNNLVTSIKQATNPERGELVYRKSSCFTCHALGGAGGLIGPDLSSLGTSSPVETIIRSVLNPNASIKEGYEMQRVVKTDGSELIGYLVSDGAAEVVIRDAMGAEVSVRKSQIRLTEKVPGSLMPAGLTAGLSKDEFANLIGFLSTLGQPGAYRVPNVRFVRRWDALSANDLLLKKLRDGGLGQLGKTESIPVQTAYSKVSGALPLNELPIITVSATRQYSVVRFDIEVLKPGNVALKFNATTGIMAWAGSKSVPVNDNQLLTNLSQGIHQISVAIDRSLFKPDELRIQLLDEGQTTAQTRLQMGK